MTGEGMNNLRYVCEDCQQSFRIQKPGAMMTGTRCTHRVGGKACGRLFHHGATDNNGPVKMVIWPLPEPERQPDDIHAAATFLRDTWQGKDTHHTKLFEAVTAVCNAVNAAGTKS